MPDFVRLIGMWWATDAELNDLSLSSKCSVRAHGSRNHHQIPWYAFSTPKLLTNMMFSPFFNFIAWIESNHITTYPSQPSLSFTPPSLGWCQHLHHLQRTPSVRPARPSTLSQCCTLVLLSCPKRWIFSHGTLPIFLLPIVFSSSTNPSPFPSQLDSH